MSDLLPPSPSAPTYNVRNFLASQSSLSSVTNSTESTRQSLFPAAIPQASNTPPPLRRTVTEPPTSPYETGISHSRNISLGIGPPVAPLHGPPIRPLDYSKLFTANKVYSELARTTDDLLQWLTVVEVGLSGILDELPADTIEKEQEDGDE
ncbi:hypothetical protein C0992_001904 [Termitomyces sp. T32_za158]|nr:hypothetical protein C0992_001904 [Termitomyces sp. T32_za158]